MNVEMLVGYSRVKRRVYIKPTGLYDPGPLCWIEPEDAVQLANLLLEAKNRVEAEPKLPSSDLVELGRVSLS